MTQTTTQLGRTQLQHPDLGYDTDDGGIALHNALASMWTSVSNHLPSRWTGNITLLNSASTTVVHYFNLAIDKLTITIFEAGVQLTEAQKALYYNITQATINSIAIQNISGGSKTFDALIFAYKTSITASNLDPSYSPVPIPVLLEGNGTLAKNNVYVSRLGWNTTQTLPKCDGSNKTISIINGNSGTLTLHPDPADYINGYQGDIKLYENESIMIRDCSTVKWGLEYITPGFSPIPITTGWNDLRFDNKYVFNCSAVTTQTLPLATGTNRTIEIQNVSSKLVNIEAQPNETINGFWSFNLYQNKTLVLRDYAAGKWVYSASSSIIVELQALVALPDVKKWLTPLLDLHIKNQNVTTYGKPYASTYIHGATAVVSAYSGGVYSPTQNRIYLVPYAQSNVATWHYINCDTGAIVPYTHGATVVAQGYKGGVYSPAQNRIYLVPNGQSNQTNWHYINCSTGAVVAYASGVTAVASAYSGGVFSPRQNRIYLVPAAQANQTNWHYIDCGTGFPTSYAHGVTAVNGAYHGGVYSPTQDRIYFVPYNQANQTNWHFINGSNGTVGTYAHGATVASSGYMGGAYSPTQNRIYFAPYIQANDATWHYINCDTGAVVGYAHGITASYGAYQGAVYSPTQDRIYFVPDTQGAQTNWHYINCSTGTIVAYSHGATANSSAYMGGTYSPTQNRIYFVPAAQANLTIWHYLQCTGDKSGICPHQFGSTIFSSTY